MIDWLKFFFLSFFSDRRAKEAAERRATNALLGMLVALVLLFGGLMTGFVGSFDKHYAAASEFREFAYSVFDVESGGAEFAVKNGRIEISSVIERFTDGAEGYTVVIDSRPVKTTYDDFDAFCTDKSGAKIDYAAWKTLDGEQRKNYTFKIEYSGKALNVAVHKTEYEDYFNSDDADETAKAKYAELREKYAPDGEGEIADGDKYCNALYELYVKHYYPDLSGEERYGAAPTLRTYYKKQIDSRKPSKFLIMFENQIAASFVTSDGVAMQIDGTYSKANGLSAIGGMSAAIARSNVDKLMRAAFDSSISMNVYVYVINIFTSLPWILAAYLVCAIMTAVTVRLTRAEKSTAMGGVKTIGFGGACKIAGMFMIGAGVITFVAAAVMSLYVSRGAAFSYSLLCLSLAAAARTLAFCIAEAVRARRKIKTGGAGGAAESAEAADPFGAYEPPTDVQNDGAENHASEQGEADSSADGGAASDGGETDTNGDGSNAEGRRKYYF